MTFQEGQNPPVVLRSGRWFAGAARKGPEAVLAWATLQSVGLGAACWLSSGRGSHHSTGLSFVDFHVVLKCFISENKEFGKL